MHLWQVRVLETEQLRGVISRNGEQGGYAHAAAREAAKTNTMGTLVLPRMPSTLSICMEPCTRMIHNWDCTLLRVPTVPHVLPCPVHLKNLQQADKVNLVF